MSLTGRHGTPWRPQVRSAANLVTLTFPATTVTFYTQLLLGVGLVKQNNMYDDSSNSDEELAVISLVLTEKTEKKDRGSILLIKTGKG